MKACAAAGLLIALSACAGNFVPADPAHPPAADMHSARVDCARQADSTSGLEPLGLAMPAAGMAVGAADLGGYYDRLDACMKSRGWLKAAQR